MLFENVKAGKIDVRSNAIFKFVPSQIRGILASMVEHDPRRRTSAAALTAKLAKLTQIWKTQVCENFLKPIRKKHKIFSVSGKPRSNLGDFPEGTATEVANCYGSSGWQRGDHVKIGEVLRGREVPLFLGGDLPRSLLLGPKPRRQLSPIPMKKTPKRRKGAASLTHAVNVFTGSRAKKDKSLCQAEQLALVLDRHRNLCLTQDCK